jgi:beta-N-acetylhexosaminidase
LSTHMDLSELNQMIGQLFMIGIPGTILDDRTIELIREYNIGGVILFTRNVEDPVQVAKLCSDLQECSYSHHGLPLFLSVDQEGGRVVRLRKPFSEFPGNTAIGMDDQPVKKAIEFARITAKEMKLVGLNMDLAPVVDVMRGEPEKHLDGRMFSDDYKEVSLLGETVIKTFQKNGIMAIAKHFPGLGRAHLDPHFNLLTIDMEPGEMENINLPPFEGAIKHSVSGIMTSHAIYPVLDPDHPATMSSLVLSELLRKKMGFDGLIITDDLEMGAIAKKWGVDQGALLAFEAGSDILLICKDQENVKKSLKLMRKRILQGEISTQRLQESIERIKKTREVFIRNKRKISLAKVEKYFNLPETG